MKKPTEKTIHGYKGFNQDMTCSPQGATPLQYATGKTLIHKGLISPCKSGLDFCQNPLSVLRHYKPGKSVYAKVEGSGDTQEHDDETVCSTLTVKASIGIRGLIQAAIDLAFTKTKGSSSAASGNYSTGAASGNYSTGTASGNSSTGAASGNSSTGAASGDSSTGAASGNYSTGAASGNYSTGAASGNSCRASVSGKESVAVANGRSGKAKGAHGCWIALTEWNADGTKIIHAQIERVDGKKIKADTWYQLQCNKFVEA